MPDRVRHDGQKIKLVNFLATAKPTPKKEIERLQPLQPLRKNSAVWRMACGAAMISFSSVWVKLAHVTPAVAGFYRSFFGAIFLLPFIKFDVIHTHNPPDTLFVVAIFFKYLFGKKFVYDHHDLSPDLFLHKYSNKGKGIYRLLLFFEKYSCRNADIVIATNESYKQIEIERTGVRENKVYVVRNGPDLVIVKREEPFSDLREKDKTILCYLGAINNQDGVQYLVEAMHKVVYKYEFEDMLLLVVGDGDYLAEIKLLSKDLRLEDFIIYTGYVKDRNLLNRYLSSADIFADAAPKSFLNDNSTFIKHMEYMVFEKPIISFALKESMHSIKNAGVFVPPNDTDKYAEALIDLASNRELRKELGKNAGARYRELSWDKVSTPLISAYQDLEKTCK
jgi:glycosyltransferase involved in cell wall biosynthesis